MIYGKTVVWQPPDNKILKQKNLVSVREPQRKLEADPPAGC